MSFVTYSLGFPTDLEPEEMESFLRTLSVLPTGGWLQRRPPVVFELRATALSTRWSLLIDRRHDEPLVGLLRAHLPSLRVVAESDAVSGDQSDELAFELALSNNERQLRTDVAEDVVRGLLAVLGGLRPGELLRLQWLVGPSLPRRIAVPQPASVHRSTWERVWGEPPLEPEQARARNAKVAEPIFGTLGRIAIVGGTAPRRKALARSTMGVLRLTSQPSVHLLSRGLPSWLVRRRMEQRWVPRIAWPVHLNVKELAVLLAWPVGGPIAVGVTYTGRRELPMPAAAVSAPVRSGKARVVGVSTFPGRSGSVSLDDNDARQHLHILGPTGVGKSTVVSSLAVQDIEAGRGVIVIEPKGDTVDDILARIPKSRHDDVVVLDPTDADRPVGLNLLDTSMVSADVAVDALLHLFKTQFSSSWGPRTQDILHASLLTIAHAPQLTLLELPLLLTNRQFRSQAVSTGRRNQALAEFWAWFDSLSDAERSQVIAPVLNKVRAFTIRDSVRRIVGQTAPAFAIRDVLRQRKILLVPLQPGKVGPETASLLGGLIVSQIWQAAQERADVDPKRRHTVMLYLDEFQTYVNLPTDLGDVLAQARSLGLAVTLAHQHLGQLVNPQMKAAVMANARSKVVFQAVDSDARSLAEALGGNLTAADLANLGRYEAYARLVVNGALSPAGSIATLPLGAPQQPASSMRRRSQKNFGVPADEIEASIAARRGSESGRESGGRRRRST